MKEYTINIILDDDQEEKLQELTELFQDAGRRATPESMASFITTLNFTYHFYYNYDKIRAQFTNED